MLERRVELKLRSKVVNEVQCDARPCKEEKFLLRTYLVHSHNMNEITSDLLHNRVCLYVTESMTVRTFLKEMY